MSSTPPEGTVTLTRDSKTTFLRVAVEALFRVNLADEESGGIEPLSWETFEPVLEYQMSSEAREVPIFALCALGSSPDHTMLCDTHTEMAVPVW